MTAAFQTNPISLATLLHGLRAGTTQLPDFQRGWVWDEGRIIGVLASVSRAFPIGAVMVLETGGEARFKARPVEGVADAGLKPAAQLILDGQQRLTSLFQALLLGRAVETVNERKQKRTVWFYVDMERALSDPANREEAFVAVGADRMVPGKDGGPALDLSTPEKEALALHFPCSALLDEFDWGYRFVGAWQNDPARNALWMQFNKKVIQQFQSYQLPVITLTRDITKEAVCHVFEKVNTGGVVLTAFELLTASLAVDGFQLRRDWLGPAGEEKGTGKPGEWTGTYLGIRPRLQAHPVLRGIQDTDLLQAAALMHTLDRHRAQPGGPPVSATRKTVLDLRLPDYLAVRGDVAAGFERAAKFLLRLNVYTAWDVPYRTQLVPLAVILGRLGTGWESHANMDKLRRWFWCGVLGEMYGGAVESRMARDVPEVLAWIAGGPEPATVRDSDFNPGRLLTLRMRLSAAYKGMYALLMGEHAYEWRTGAPLSVHTHAADKVDIHHIFPKRWCNDNGVDWDRADCIVNKTAISAATNQSIGGRAPSEYLALLVKKGTPSGKLDGYLQSHCIEPQHIYADDFEAFFAARKVALLHLIADATGKVLLPETTDAEPVPDDMPEEAAEAAP